MISLAVEKAYINHKFNKNRMDTDALFALPFGSVSLKGNLDRAIRFIEDYQLMNPELWARFVTQFRATSPKADDADYGWRGEYWGKMMRGACFTYQYTKNKALYDILTETVKDMMSTADQNGRISSYSYEKQYNGWDIWSRKYVMLGMEYFIEICEDESFIAQITRSLKGQADYMLSTLGLESEGKILITKTSTHWHGMNSSSLLEPIVRIYNLTGEQKYLDFATYIVDCGVIYDEGVSIFELAYENKLAPYQYPQVKAYEMMSCFEGLLEYYRVTKIEKWKTAIINFANKVRETEISVIGSSGCTHELFDHTLVRQVNTDYNGVLQETCVTVTWMKFCFQLLCLTGDSVFADEMEKSIYNALIGAINFDKLENNGGLPFDSYSPLLFNTRLRGIGGLKIMADGNFYGCCACIGAAGTGLIGMQSSMLSKNGIVINTYAPEEIKALSPYGEEIALAVNTEYPANGTVNIEVLSDCIKPYCIALRIPEWSQATLVSVNGTQSDVKAGTYASFEQIWKKGDYITVKFDMRCRLIEATPDEKDVNSAYHVSLKRGPIMLARDARLDGDIESIVDFKENENGEIPCKIEKSTSFDYFYTFKVKENNGNEISMIDYSSAGRTWDARSMTTVWMPTKNYWNVDLGKDIIISSPNFWDNSDNKFSFTVDQDGKVKVTTEQGEKFRIEAQENGNVKIKALSSGLYLDVSGTAVTVSENGKEWKIEKFAQNRYKISDLNGKFINGSNDAARSPYITVGEPDIKPVQVIRFEN